MAERDISQYSDDELQSMLGAHDQDGSGDISSIPTEELQKMSSPPSDVAGSVAAGLRGMREAIPFGQDIGSFATAHVGNPLTGQAPSHDFSAEKRQQMERDTELAKEHPYSYGAGMATGVGAQLLAPEVGLVKAGMTTPAKILAGSTEGMAYGLGEGVTPEERLANAVKGAGLGAGATGVITAAEKGLKAAGEGISHLRQGAPGAAAREVEGAVQTDVRRGADRLTPEEYNAALERGQPVLPVDLGGGQVASKLREATNISPEAEATIHRPLEQRNRQQQSRYEQHLQDLMGHDLNAAGMQEDLRDIARSVNGPAYRAAYEAPEAQNIWNADLQRLVQAPAVQAAIEPAMIKAANKAVLGEAPEVASPFIINRRGQVEMKPGAPHSLEFWDNVKHAMDDKIGALKRAGDPSWVDINRIKNKLLATLDNSVKDAAGNSLYGNARTGAQRMFGADNAFDAGLSFLSTKSTLNSSQLKKMVEGMSDAERELFGHGVAADMLNTIRNQKGRRDISGLFDSPAEREKITMALGEEKAAQFEAFHRVENIMDRAYKAMGANSTTAKQYARMQDKGLTGKLVGRIASMGLEGGVGYGVTHSLTGTLAPVIIDLLGTAAKHGMDKAHMAKMEKLGEMLVSPDPAVRNQVIQMIASKPSALAKLRNVETSLRRMGVATGVEGHREERAKGGKVYPAKRLTLLEKAALKAHSDLANGSKPLMDMPDEHIAHHLHAAKDQ